MSEKKIGRKINENNTEIYSSAHLAEGKNAILRDIYFFQKLKQTRYSQEAQLF